MDTVTLRKLAEDLGMDRSHLRKYVLRLGIEPLRVRTHESRNQETLALTLGAERVRIERANAGFGSQRSVVAESGNLGVFYVVILDPEVRANRVKFGFTNNLDSRMSTYRTINPDSTVAGYWGCNRNWEAAAIAALANVEACNLVAGEVYDCGDVEEVVRRGDKFFSMMPTTKMEMGGE